MQPLADLARIELASELLADGAQTVVWIDADVLVFRPRELILPKVEDCAFTREVWLSPKNAGSPGVMTDRVNNCVSIFQRDGVFLPYYVRACKVIALNQTSQLGKAQVGTRFLTGVHSLAPFTLVRNVGNFSPHILGSLVRRDAQVISDYRDMLREPLYAANLCASLENHPYHGEQNSAEAYHEACRLLLSSFSQEFFG